MYNRYLPQREEYTPVGNGPPVYHPGSGNFSGGELGKLLKKVLPEKLDSGDLLLLLVVLLLWREEEDTDLLLALGAALLMGDNT